MSCGNTCSSVLLSLENLPGVGHLIAMCYGCANNKDKAERAAIKASVGICCGLCNCPVEAADEVLRKRSDRLISKKLTPRPEWMKKHQGRIIRYLCLPASHQSATYHMEKKLRSIPMIEGWSRCQKYNIYEQLMSGIRFLDLRLMDYEGDIWLHHNVVTCIKFKDVLLTVKKFITDYPSEITGLYLTGDGKPVDWVRCNTYIQELLKDRLMFEHMRDMKISDLVDQGKNVMIFGIPQVAYAWRNLDFRWPNKSRPSELQQDLMMTIDDMEGKSTYNLFWYKAECTPNAGTVTRGIGGIPGVAAVRRSEEKYEFLEDLAAVTNKAVLDVIQNSQKLPFNIFSIDYIQDDIIDCIVKSNDNAAMAVNALDITSYGSEYESASVFTDHTATATVLSEDYPMRAAKAIEIRETTM